MEKTSSAPENMPLGSSAAAPPVEKVVPGWHPSRFFTLIRGRSLLFLSLFLSMLFFSLTFLILREDLRPTPWDVWVTRTVQTAPEPVGEVLVAVSVPGFEPWNWIMVFVVVGVMALMRWYTEAVFTALAALGGLSSELVKNLVDRPRPTPDLVSVVRELHTFSFPSGHVTGYATIFGFLFYLAYTMLPVRHPLKVTVLVFTAVMIVLVAPSRIYMGQHWFSDTLAGYALGFAYLFIVIELHRFWLRTHPKMLDETNVVRETPGETTSAP